ncbi:MAG: extracellular solute-binding protein [Anaerolineales bacterium]|nr:extracellular solute-binding protein [Anaerolineales bacterium]
MSRKNLTFFMSLLLVFAFVLGACQPAATPTEEPAATEAMEEPTEVMEEPTEVMEEPTEVMEEPTAEPTEEPALAVDPTGQTVVFWHVWGAGSAAEGLTKIVADFNASNEWGITVEAVDQGNQGDLQTAVNAAIATGELPNVTPGFPNAITTWYAAGAMAELNDFINDPMFGLTTDELAAIYPANLDSGSLADGTQVGMPIHQSANVLFYNNTWAQELGFTAAPATAEEFKAQACAAAAANNADDNPDNDGTGGLVTRGVGASDVAAWLFAFEGSLLNEAGDTYTMNTEQMKAVALFLKDLKDSGCWYTTEGFPNPEFATRQALFAISSTAGIPFQASAFTDAANADSWGLIPFPGPNGKLAVNAFGQLIGVVDQGPEANLAAWIWLKHFTSPEIQAEWITYSAYHPSQTTTEQFLGDYIAANPIYATGLSLSQYGEAEPNLPSWGSIRGAISDTFNAILAAADEAAIDALLAELETTSADLLAESQ